MPRKRSTHNIDPELDELLSAIAEAMEDTLRPAPSKSGLLNKALSLYIEECKKDERLRPIIEEVQARQAEARSGHKVVSLEPKRAKPTKRGSLKNQGRP